MSCLCGALESEVLMDINYGELGKRISHFRNKRNLSQEDLSETLHVTREYVSYMETGKRKPALKTIVEIANTLNVSTDDLLVDSLENSVSTADSELHRLLLDCTPTEEEIITRTAKELKSILYGLGI